MIPGGHLSWGGVEFLLQQHLAMAQASVLSTVSSAVPRAHFLPYQPLGGTAEEVKTGRNHVLPRSEGLGWQRSPGPTLSKGTMIPSAHPGPPWGLGEEAWLWSLEPADLTKPPPCLPLCLTLTLPRGVNGLWQVYGTALERRLITGYRDQCHVTATLQSHEELVRGRGRTPLTAFPRWETQGPTSN